MTTEEMTTMLVSMTEETNAATLSTYLTLAAEAVLQRLYPYKDTSSCKVPAKYHGVQVEIAAFMLNKRGAEGEKAHSENGITRSYESGDIPDSLLRRIVSMAGVF